MHYSSVSMRIMIIMNMISIFPERDLLVTDSRMGYEGTIKIIAYILSLAKYYRDVFTVLHNYTVIY